MGAESINTLSWNWADPSNPVADSEADSITDATQNTDVNLPDGHLGGNGNWLYGIHHSNVDMPIEQVKWKPIYYGDPDPAELKAIHSDVTVGHGFQPVNGLMWYKFLGNSIKSGSIHQVRGNARGATLPVWISRAEMSGGNADINLSAVGCKMSATTQTFHMNGAFSTGTMEIASIRSQDGAIAGNGLAGTPLLPSGIGNTYRAASTANDVFSWKTG